VSLPSTSSCVHCVAVTNYDVEVASYGIIFTQGFIKSSQPVGVQTKLTNVTVVLPVKSFMVW
jgi:uncharacterized OB-fold protein